MTVSEIFAQHGEPYFRDGEARVIARLLEAGPSVVATRGGAFMREETRRRIHDKAVSIWLQADGDIILRRVKRRADRPLLQRLLGGSAAASWEQAAAWLRFESVPCALIYFKWDGSYRT